MHSDSINWDETAVKGMAEMLVSKHGLRRTDELTRAVGELAQQSPELRERLASILRDPQQAEELMKKARPVMDAARREITENTRIGKGRNGHLLTPQELRSLVGIDIPEQHPAETRADSDLETEDAPQDKTKLCRGIRQLAQELNDGISGDDRYITTLLGDDEWLPEGVQTKILRLEDLDGSTLLRLWERLSALADEQRERQREPSGSI